MATKKQIQNMVDLINEKYQFSTDVETWRIKANKTFKGWEIALGPATLQNVVLTQYREVSSDMCMLILSMLFHDILERQSLGHYTVTKRI